MNVIFVEPAFPANQMEFVRALHKVGATVIGIGERPGDWLPDDLRSQMSGYVQIGNVCDETALLDAVRQIQSKVWVDRLEATVESHMMTAARVREKAGIPGTSVHTTYLCRDKPAMKEALREAGIPCAQSDGVDSPEGLRDFAERVGYPLILKPRDAAGAANTHRIQDASELESVIEESGLAHGISFAVEEFIEGHEGFYDTICRDGQVVHEFATHYYPNVLEAMRTRWISPQFVTTNRLSEEGYDEVREMGQRVIEALGIGTSATHMEWFYGPKGLKFSEIGCRPPGVGAWDVYAAANEMDIYAEWARAITGQPAADYPSRRFAAGMIALRPDRDGTIRGYQGLEELRSRYGQWIVDAHFPPAGTGTQPVEAGYMANAWMRVRHTDYDALREILDWVGQNVKVFAG